MDLELLAGLRRRGDGACLDALRDARIFWPPDVVWEGLRSAQRLELGGGIALMVVTLVTSVVRGRARAER